jgi:hypothetical protein
VAERRRVGERRPGDAGKKQRRDDRRVSRSGAGLVCDQRGEADQPFGDAAATHDFAGEDKERHGEQHETVDAGKAALGDDGKVDVHRPQPDGPGEPERESDRHSERQQRDENREHRRHQEASCGSGGPASSEAIRTNAAHSISAPPIPTAR